MIKRLVFAIVIASGGWFLKAARRPSSHWKFPPPIEDPAEAAVPWGGDIPANCGTLAHMGWKIILRDFPRLARAWEVLPAAEQFRISVQACEFGKNEHAAVREAFWKEPTAPSTRQLENVVAAVGMEDARVIYGFRKEEQGPTSVPIWNEDGLRVVAKKTERRRGSPIKRLDAELLADLDRFPHATRQGLEFSRRLQDEIRKRLRVNPVGVRLLETLDGRLPEFVFYGNGERDIMSFASGADLLNMNPRHIRTSIRSADPASQARLSETSDLVSYFVERPERIGRLANEFELEIFHELVHFMQDRAFPDVYYSAQMAMFEPEFHAHSLAGEYALALFEIDPRRFDLRAPHWKDQLEVFSDVERQLRVWNYGPMRTTAESNPESTRRAVLFYKRYMEKHAGESPRSVLRFTIYRLGSMANLGLRPDRWAVEASSALRDLENIRQKVLGEGGPDADRVLAEQSFDKVLHDFAGLAKDARSASESAGESSKFRMLLRAIKTTARRVDRTMPPALAEIMNESIKDGRNEKRSLGARVYD